MAFPPPDSGPDDPDVTLRSLREGDRVFGRYVLKEILGRGGMGVVWLAQDETLDTLVALKFLPESLKHDANAVADLKRETRRSRELTHANIVRVHELFEDTLKGQTAISMEYVKGKTLNQIRHEKPFTVLQPDQILPWLEQLASAVDYAHVRAKVVHRDIKPSNLMITDRGELKVCDFGISAALSENTNRLSSKKAEASSSGSPPYMSPQQIMGESAKTSDDIYAIGATLYELITGKPPFHSGNVFMQVKDKIPPCMTKRRMELQAGATSGLPEIPQSWEKTVAACLAKNASQRPVSVGEIYRRCAGDPTTDPVQQYPQSLGSKTSTIKGIVVSILIVALAIGAFYFWRHQSPQSSAQNSSIAAVVPPAKKNPLIERNSEASEISFRQLRPDVWLSIHPVRVKDFRLFAEAVNLPDSESPVLQDQQQSASWKTPGFNQGDEHPVVAVSWDDARQFCDWLTLQDRKSGALRSDEVYRLPSESDWSQALGEGATYPWGDAWPPPTTLSANLAGLEASQSAEVVLEDRRDPFPYTSPVGYFGANSNGFTDMIGNVAEWCEDRYSEVKS